MNPKIDVVNGLPSVLVPDGEIAKFERHLVGARVRGLDALDEARARLLRPRVLTYIFLCLSLLREIQLSLSLRR